MDKIGKLLAKLKAKALAQIKAVLNCLRSGQTQDLDIKKLKSRDDIFRVRKGNFRIIYRFENKKIFVLAIERRKEKTYKFI